MKLILLPRFFSRTTARVDQRARAAAQTVALSFECNSGGHGRCATAGCECWHHARKEKPAPARADAQAAAERSDGPLDSLLLVCRCGASHYATAAALDYLDSLRAARDLGWRDFGRGLDPGAELAIAAMRDARGGARALVNARCPRCAGCAQCETLP
ncbi:MAG TPA: hypothetical protein VNE82_12755 [Candidatus Binataceae bacterium]|nr:hypothetical protein [Candidatus Binataceae bacterium]HVB80801.1 hypothetical protein [Candidatus Binataceae bacterium]